MLNPPVNPLEGAENDGIALGALFDGFIAKGFAGRPNVELADDAPKENVEVMDEDGFVGNDSGTPVG
jgi:hypothetical protein